MRRVIILLWWAAFFVGSACAAADARADAAGGEIAGTVVDAQGRPVEAATVDVWTWYPGNETKTDKAGHFRLGGLGSSSTVELRISKANFSPWYEPRQPNGVSDLQVVLGDKTFFTGTVLSPNGNPVPDALVRAGTGPREVGDQIHIDSVWTETRSDADGHYKLYVAPDSYVIQTRVPDTGVARFKAGIDADEAVTQDIRLEAGVTLVVHCVEADTGGPVVGAGVTATGQKGMRAVSDEKGDAVIEHLPAEKFSFEVSCKGFVKFWSPEAANQSMRDRPANLALRWEAVEFNVAADMQPVTVQLEKGVTISGHVVDPDGKPVARATVATAKCGWGDSIDMTQRFTARTAADGSFKLVVPASGDDQLDLIGHDGDYNQWRHWANGVTEPMQTKAGENVDNLTITLTVPGAVKGQVVDGGGTPLAGKAVRVMSADDRDSRYLAPQAVTDKDGNYQIKFVRPGDVLVQVEPFYIRQPDGQTSPIFSTAVTVGPGETKDGVAVQAK